MSDLDAFKATYFDECAELLLELEEQFAAIERGARDADRLNAVFRAIHSIKGGAGAFGFEGLVGFAHAFETLLDEVRGGTVALSAEVVALSIRAVDIVADFVAAARGGAALGPDHGAFEKARFEALASGAGEGAPMEEFDIAFTPVAVDLGRDEAGTGGGWRIAFTPFPRLYERANDPLLLFRELALLGEMTVAADLKPLPELSGFDPFGVYCGWIITLANSSASEEAVREVFEFVEGDCEIAVTRLEAQEEQEEDAFPSFLALAEEVVTSRPPVPEPVFAAPLPEAPAEEAGAGPRAASVRVDLEKIDRVVNMVGELVIAQSMLTQQMDEAIRDRYQELVRGVEALAQTTRSLQDAVMAIRAQPVKSVFSRMPRLVRELAGRTGKKIRLETLGEATEIDKTVIEQLADPLTHMVRNSADHGIESPERRRAAGKAETGTIRLSAEQAGGSILIVVEDDGQGIDRARVLALGRERGIVAPDAQPSDEEIDNLIFAPGFSTAREVSDISGRGVGMDVVLSNIARMGGSVTVRSAPGRGTRLTLRLPLTLAVLDVMLVELAGAAYVIPLSSIVETRRNARADIERLPGGGGVLAFRGDYVKVIDLAERFGMPTQEPEDRRFIVLCEAEGELKIALVVDAIIGQQQVVIKSLEENFERIEGVAGGTILGDGNVALILDVQSLGTGPLRKSAA